LFGSLPLQLRGETNHHGLICSDQSILNFADNCQFTSTSLKVEAVVVISDPRATPIRLAAYNPVPIKFRAGMVSITTVLVDLNVDSYFAYYSAL